MNSKSNSSGNSHKPTQPRKLENSIGPWQASSLVVGTIIGTGIFLKSATMAQLLGSSLAVALAWIISGVLSFAGALTYAELSAQFPKSGGEYAFLKAGYGSLPAFLYGWMRVWIGAPGSIAAYAMGAATFLGAVISFAKIPGEAKTVAVIFVIFFSAINCLRLHWGARVQTFLTVLKIILIIGLVMGVVLLGVKQPEFPQISQVGHGPAGIGAFGLAMIAALWAYDGWNNLPMIGEEVHNPKRNLPIALGFGLLTVMALYLAANFAYFNVLSVGEIQQAYSTKFPQALPVATLAAGSFLNQFGVPVISLAFVISALGALNGSIMTGARVPFAMARDGLFWKKMAQVSGSSHVPMVSIVVQAVLASILAILGTFDQLTDYVVVSAWVFYALTASTVFIFRKRNKQQGLHLDKSQFKVLGYPIVPILFILTAVFLVINSVVHSPNEALIGAFIILAGLPFYIFLKAK